MRKFTYCLVVVLLIAAPGFGAESLVNVTVESAKQPVQARIDSEWVYLEAGDTVPLKSRIRTGEEGKATLSIMESSTVTIQSETTMSVEEAARKEIDGGWFSDDMTEEDVRLKQIEGSIKHRVDDDDVNTDYTIQTPNSVVGVRGTIFETSNDKRRTSILVADGSVEAQSRTSDRKAAIEAGQRGVVQDGDVAIEEANPETVKELKEGETTDRQSARGERSTTGSGVRSVRPVQKNQTDVSSEQRTTDRTDTISVPREVVREAVKRLVDGWNSGTFEQYLAADFYDRERLQSALSGDVSRNASMNLLSVNDTQVVDSSVERTDRGARVTATVLVTMRAQIEYETSDGFKRATGESEMQLSIEYDLVDDRP